MRALSEKKLARLIRPAGYYNIKARRLKNFLEFLWKNYRGRLKRMKSKELPVLREQLLSVCGIGPETADSILLYALGKPIFVVDTYTRRIMSRHGVVKESYDYQAVQKVFMGHLRHDARIFNEYHALLVKCAKEFCKKHKMNCSACPMGRRGSYD
jgi:endonuclease-3 related protein